MVDGTERLKILRVVLREARCRGEENKYICIYTDSVTENLDYTIIPRQSMSGASRCRWMRCMNGRCGRRRMSQAMRLCALVSNGFAWDVVIISATFASDHAMFFFFFQEGIRLQKNFKKSRKREYAVTYTVAMCVIGKGGLYDNTRAEYEHVLVFFPGAYCARGIHDLVSRQWEEW